MVICASEVEEWIEANPDWLQDYFLRKVDINLVNKWLMMHGFDTIQSYITTRRNSISINSVNQENEPVSPDARSCDSSSNDHFCFRGRHTRSNSKKFLRHDFARARMRSMFRTCEDASSEAENALRERRSSLKGMRQFLSLPPNSVNMLSLLIQSKVRLPRYTSIDEELKRQLRMCNEKDFFMEIVKDISHDLDLKSLTSRILINISILLSADRCSLFFVEGQKEKRMLVSKVFDMYSGTDCLPASLGDNCVRIPWGHGIIGHVARTGDTVNITNASQDPRYNDDVDVIVGYTTHALLCMPIRNADEEVVGVVQVINKLQRDDVTQYVAEYDLQGFQKEDERTLEMYLTLCGMAISNAQAIESYTREYDRNKALLEVVHDLFEEQTSVDSVVKKIMARAKTLLKCERCVVLLSDKEHRNNSTEFSRVFDLQPANKNGRSKLCSRNWEEIWRNNKLGELVAATGETVNISDIQTDPRFQNTLMPTSGDFVPKTLLCKPIRNRDLQIIGVALLINKLDGSCFDQNDDELFEAFTIFCGLGINNCMLYDELARSAAKQTVALELLSYHALVPDEDVACMKIQPVPESASWRLTSLDFGDFTLTSDEMITASIRIFRDMGFIDKFHIDYETLVRWLLTVRKNYRNVAYHNWRHAFNVCQFMFSLLQVCEFECDLGDLEKLALIVACLCHDLDHRGTNNAFQQKSSSALSQLYGTQATMEHHHFNHAVMILNSEAHNIFSKLNSDDYSEVIKLLKSAILATDLSLHIQVRQKFIPLVESGLYSWDETDQRDLLRSALMTASDVASITKPWDVQRKAADLVMTEFFDQGDKERTMLKIQPLAFMDRERHEELPRLQMDWIDGICLPLYKSLARVDKHLKVLVERIHKNREHWEILDGQRLARAVARETNV